MISINDFLPRPKKPQKSGQSVAVATVSALQTNENQVVLTESSKVVALRPQGAELARPSSQAVDATRERTQAALDAILDKKMGVQSKPAEEGPSLIRYTPSGAGSGKTPTERTLKIVDVKYDPFEPARHKHVKAPARPPSPPAPVLKAAAPKLSAEEQRQWYIPPSVSGWKNNKGFVIDIEKRVAADGRYQEPQVQAGDRMAKLAESLNQTESSARQELMERQERDQEKAEQTQNAQELRLKLLAQRARKRALPDAEDGSEERARDRAARLRAATRDAERDISETVALGGKPTLSGDAQFDSRLFGRAPRSKDLYDEPLFAAQQAVREIYQPKSDAETGGPVQFERIEDKYE